MTKLPRLGEHPTIEDAAKWLTCASGEEWSTQAVLSRISEEWEGSESSQIRAFAPETLMVVIHSGDVLLDASNKFRALTIHTPQIFQLCAPIEGFVAALDLSGRAKPPTLTNDSGGRYLCQHEIILADIRLKRDWVKHLLPPLDALIFEASKGEHQWLLEAATELGSKTESQSEYDICQLPPAPDHLSDTACHALEKWEKPGRLEFKARQIGQEWMRNTKPKPGVDAIARYVEKELKNRDIRGPRGDYWDWKTIKKEALRGITGRKPNGK